MREPARMKRILGEIEKTWEENPDMRFFQLLINMGLIEDDALRWNYEDDTLEEFFSKVF